MTKEYIESKRDSRLYYDRSMKRNCDEVLETIFDAVWHNNATPEEESAYPQLLDPYVLALFADNAIRFGNSAQDEHEAVTWASQFGQLRIWPLDEVAAKRYQLPPGQAYGAKIGPMAEGQQWVYGRGRRQVAILAGLQVLREQSWQLLNPTLADACN